VYVVDRRMFPRENPVTALLTYGEGWHNYHHVFPWDYKISEHGFSFFNWSTAFIELSAWLGWAYDLKTASSQMVEYKVKRSHPIYGKQEIADGDSLNSEKLPSWGLDDEDTPEEDYKMVMTLRPPESNVTFRTVA
jgi:stearoyl-CoA desaturase (delta-9 desaturase)